MTEIVDVAIIGAGPYGLSIAAHLAERGVDFRIFGSPMHTWRTSMPEGMVLKSEGNGSDLYDPAGEMTLGRFCAERGLPYRDVGFPIPLDTFVAYGIAFQQRFVPRLEDRLVTDVKPASYGFDLHLQDGEVAPARRVIVAAGIRAYEYMPPKLAALPAGLASHSAMHVKVDQFAGKEVAIIGGGASAVNLAPLLLRVGASVTMIVRRPRIAYCGPPTERSLWDKVKEPESGLGTGWRSWACCAMPMVFHAMPEVIPRHGGAKAFASGARLDAAATGGRHRSHHRRCVDRPGRIPGRPGAARVGPSGRRKAGRDGRSCHRRNRL